MKNTSEQLLSFAENELMKKESIRRAVLSEMPRRERKPIAWTRILLPIAACLVLICGTVLAIPSARAEVFRWLRIERPEQYLTEDPEDRTPVEALDSLIIPPASIVPEDTVSPAVSEAPAELPIGSVTGNKILQVCDEPIWQQIASDFSMELGETMFDGKDLYLSLTMRGLTALPIVEAYTGGNATQVRIPDDQISEYTEDGTVPDMYKDKSVSMYEHLEGRFFLALNDGLEFPLGSLHALESNPELISVLDQLYDKYGEDPLTDSDREEISRDMIAWLNGRELRGVVKRQNLNKDGDVFFRNGDINDYVEVENVLETLLTYADENGILTASVLYRVATDLTGKYEVKLEAELGTTSFDLAAYKNITGDTLRAADPEVVFGSQEVIISYGRWIETSYSKAAYTVTNIPTNLKGVRIQVNGDAGINGLGIHGIDVTVTLPDDWTEEQCEGFCHSIWFVTEIDGEIFFASSDRYEENERRSIHYVLTVENIPYDRLDKIETVHLIPRLRYSLALLVGKTRTELLPNEPLSEPKTKENVSWAGDIIDLTDGIIVFTRVR